MTGTLRAAGPGYAGQAGAILYRFNSATDWLPDLYSLAETIGFCGTMIDHGWVTVAERAGRVVGFLARDGEEICALYLQSGHTGQGIGRRLLNRAKAQCDALQLRVFQANTGAQRFYAREGFVETGRSDGARNDETLPDLQLTWRKETAK